MLTPDRRRDFFEGAYLQYYLEQSKVFTIFVDEFRVNMNNRTMYNRSPRGKPALLSVERGSWAVSFVIALSSRQIEGIMASTWSIKTVTFNWFLRDVWNIFQNEGINAQNAWFIFDNASIHRNSKSIVFMEKYGLRWISIPPYSPQLNLAEKVIAIIKNKLNERLLGRQHLNLGLVKKIVDEISPEAWRKWINSS